MKLRKALITGGCGFVGRHFSNTLVNEDYEVTAIDDLSEGIHPKFWPKYLMPTKNFRFIKVDVLDYFRSITESFSLIIHLAAVVGGRATIENNPLKLAKNIAIDSMFFSWLPRLSPKPTTVLYFSSSAVYPIHLQRDGQNICLSEDMVDFSENISIPDMTYGWAKLTGEFLARYAVKKYGLNVVIYRPFSGYAEDQALPPQFLQLCL